MNIPASQPQFVQNQESDFLALFPHRYDFLWAKHPEPGERPQWKTENRYPLSDRAIEEGKHLYGVRFGPSTQYLLIDIDAHSIYHSKRDHQILSTILEPLERIGITDAIPLQSSRNQGIHLYIPFDQPIKSWLSALVVQTLLERAGFKFTPGQLEIFPNPRSYTGATPTSNYRGHRLPLQNGSFLLNQDWQPIFTSPATFVQRWKFIQQHRNQIDLAECERIAFQSSIKTEKLTSSAQSFFDGLLSEIQPGWTGSGQTNNLLGRIAQKHYIFDSIDNPELITEDGLTAAIAATARSLPGYEEFCRHQHEIERRARDWARDIIADPRYYPYKRRNLKQTQHTDNPTEITWNERQRATARSRIQNAIAQLVQEGNYPTTIMGRTTALEKLGINRGTLYKHRDLWHPTHSPPQGSPQPILNEPEPLQNAMFTPVPETSELLKPLQNAMFTPVSIKLVPRSKPCFKDLSQFLSSEGFDLSKTDRLQKEKSFKNSEAILIREALPKEINRSTPSRRVKRSHIDPSNGEVNSEVT